MKIKKLILPCIYFALAFFTLFAAGCSKGGELNKITIKGSTSILPLSFKLADEYMKHNKVSVSISAAGSGTGINALIENICDIAASSRGMEQSELSLARERGMDIEEVVIAYDMIVPVVNAAAGISDLTISQLQAVFSGEIRNWSELGFGDRKIIVVSRDINSGTFGVWNRKIISEDKLTRGAIRVATNAAMVDMVGRTPGSIGYISFGYSDKSIRVLSINGIRATIKDGKNGKYPVSRKLYYIIDRKKASPAALSFIDYAVSDAGQKIISDAGYIPL